MERDELIFNYLDNLCTPEEKLQVEHLLANDKEFAIEFKEIQQMNSLMLEHNIDTAPSNFANNVIATIKQSEGVQLVQQSNLIKVLVIIITLLSLVISLKFMDIKLPTQIDFVTSFIPTKIAIYTIIVATFWGIIEYFLSVQDMKEEV